jgi:hypothetical protein
MKSSKNPFTFQIMLFTFPVKFAKRANLIRGKGNEKIKKKRFRKIAGPLNLHPKKSGKTPLNFQIMLFTICKMRKRHSRKGK